MIASSNRLKSISLFRPFLRKFGILQGNRMLVDFKTYLFPSPRSLLSPPLMLLDRKISQTMKAVSNYFGTEDKISRIVA